jgi:hypothetical protein
MTSNDNIGKLQRALKSYSEATIKFYKDHNRLSEKLISGFSDWYGLEMGAVGVPPSGDWDPSHIYRGDRYEKRPNTVLDLEPAVFGLAIKVPENEHVQDSRSVWLRVRLEINQGENCLKVKIGDEHIISINDNGEPDAEAYEKILDCALKMFGSPALSTNKNMFGFPITASSSY